MQNFFEATQRNSQLMVEGMPRNGLNLSLKMPSSRKKSKKGENSTHQWMIRQVGQAKESQVAKSVWNKARERVAAQV